MASSPFGVAGLSLKGIRHPTEEVGNRHLALVLVLDVGRELGEGAETPIEVPDDLGEQEHVGEVAGIAQPRGGREHVLLQGDGCNARFVRSHIGVIGRQALPGRGVGGRQRGGLLLEGVPLGAKLGGSLGHRAASCAIREASDPRRVCSSRRCLHTLKRRQE
jgi:hypothetical protein